MLHSCRDSKQVFNWSALWVSPFFANGDVETWRPGSATRRADDGKCEAHWRRTGILGVIRFYHYHCLPALQNLRTIHLFPPHQAAPVTQRPVTCSSLLVVDPKTRKIEEAEGWDYGVKKRRCHSSRMGGRERYSEGSMPNVVRVDRPRAPSLL
jgi:hypothetical protein